MRIIRLATAALLLSLSMTPAAARTFVHPGLSYTQADLDRMKAMVDAGREPYHSTFLKLQESGYSSPTQGVTDRGTQIAEGKFNGTVGNDGRRAHDLALMWHITGDRRYADKAVEFLNANSNYTNTSARGTGPLDNGKVYLLIEAAELMRDYDGWAAEDIERFKDMLVYPGYSSTENMYDKAASMDDNANGITFYWNIFNFDASRFGNQGLFAARAMAAMGVFLDNEKIYDRAIRYLQGMPHRTDDLPYVPGPPVTSSTPYPLDETNPEAGDNTTSFMKGYKLERRLEDVEDYGYDEQLRYYIYANGQCQESCRDQDHVTVGIGLFVDIAEIAWNQGDDLYSALDNRILTGLEWSFRYNHSLLEGTPWEPKSYSGNEAIATFDNGVFLQVRSRSGRWESVKPSTKGRGDALGSSGNRECALAHYAVRTGLDPERYRWLTASRDYMIEKYGCENWGKDSNHRYEWLGWGTLTKRRTPAMAGNPVSFATGRRVDGIHTVPCTIIAGDYDWHPTGNSATSPEIIAKASADANTYRNDGNVTLTADGHVLSPAADTRLNYTVRVADSGQYDIYVTYRATKASTLSTEVDGEESATGILPANDRELTTVKLCTVPLAAGADVITLISTSPADDIEIASIAVKAHADDTTNVTDAVVDNMDAATEYYNPAGIKINNPHNGLYIRRQGDTTTKVLVK